MIGKKLTTVGMARRPRAADVARLADVSTATVSRVFNAPDKVQGAVRERVFSAASALGWRPNAAGRALAQGRSMLAGIVIPTLANGIFASHVGALQSEFGKVGMTALIGVSNHEPDAGVHSVEALLAHGVEAIAVVAEDYNSSAYDIIAERDVPCMITHGYRADLRFPTIGIDNLKAFHQIAKHLLDLGHTNIGMIAPPRYNNARVQARVEGVRLALAQQGLAIRPGNFHEGPWSIVAAREAFRSFLANAAPPTAVICGNDQIAFGVIAEAQAQGLSLPKDLSVTGFDDDPMSAHLRPGLTTMRVDNAEMGRLCARSLIDQLSMSIKCANIEMAAELIVRESTSEPRLSRF